MLARVFDEDEFLSPYGLRACRSTTGSTRCGSTSRDRTVSVDYEPGESTTGMFGGNSNWRGPVWMPVNYLLLRNLQRYAHSLGAAGEVEYPTGSGHTQGLADCAEDLRRRLISLFLRGPTAAGPATAGSTSCRTTRAGATTSRSTSTSTATTAPGWAPPTRPGGPASWPT